MYSQKVSGELSDNAFKHIVIIFSGILGPDPESQEFRRYAGVINREGNQDLIHATL